MLSRDTNAKKESSDVLCKLFYCRITVRYKTLRHADQSCASKLMKNLSHSLQYWHKDGNELFNIEMGMDDGRFCLCSLQQVTDLSRSKWLARTRYLLENNFLQSTSLDRR